MGRIIAENKHTGKLYPVDSKAIYRVIYEVVDVLPTENIKTSVIYCVPIIGKENEYDMFLYIDSDWVSVGSGSIDLSDYCTKEETAELLSDKMDLAPLNPTAEQIAAMAGGQLYGDKIAQDEYDEALAFKLPQGFYYEGVLKFFSAHTSDSRYPRVYRSQMRPLIESVDFDPKVGSFWVYNTNDNSVQSLYVLSYTGGSGSSQYWRKLNNHINVVNALPVSDPMPRKINYSYNISGYEIPPYDVNDEIIVSANGQVTLYKCLGYTKVYDSALGGYKAVYNWQEKSRIYTKTEIDNIIGAISTLSFEVVQSKPVSDIKTNVIYLVPKSTAETNNVYEEWIYVNNAWELIGSTEIDLSNYMALAPLNPTAQEIEAMSSGQIYGDTTNHKGVIKGGQEFYDTTYVDDNFDKKFVVYGYRADAPGHPSTDGLFPLFNTADKGDLYEVGQRLLYTGPYGMIFSYILEEIIYSPPNIYSYLWGRDRSIFYTTSSSSSPQPPTTSSINTYNDKYGNTLRPDYLFYSGDIFVIADRSYHSIVKKVFVCASSYSDPNGYHYTWEEIPLKAASLSGYGITDAYTKTEINEMIGDIETALSEV